MSVIANERRPDASDMYEKEGGRHSRSLGRARKNVAKKSVTRSSRGLSEWQGAINEDVGMAEDQLRPSDRL